MNRFLVIRKSILYFGAMVLFTQLLAHLMDLNWPYLAAFTSSSDPYFHEQFIHQLRLNLLVSYGIFLFIKITFILRTLKQSPLYVVPEGAKMTSIKNKQHLTNILVFGTLASIIGFYFFTASDKGMLLLNFLSSFITSLVPLGLLVDSAVFLYPDRIKAKGKFYMDYDISEILEDEDEDSSLASFHFKHNNEQIKLSVPLEHRNALYSQLLLYAKVNKPRFDEWPE